MQIVPGESYESKRIALWVESTFGPQVLNDTTERGRRTLEESIELGHTLGVTKDEALKLVERVYSRPVGNTIEEVGDVGFTLYAMCHALGLVMEDVIAATIGRNLLRSREKVRAKHQAKADAGVAIALDIKNSD